eukprot:c34506_g1_i1.p1 GENE.c34506_g1_i1~~c34506_g1_i1.p1  ORF type:complete len:157 (+),score=71.71 c34506_g1_i1:24-494(+)
MSKVHQQQQQGETQQQESAIQQSSTPKKNQFGPYKNCSQAELDEIEYLQNNLDPDYNQYAKNSWEKYGPSVRGWVSWTFWRGVQHVHNIGGVVASVVGINDLKYQAELDYYNERQEQLEKTKKLMEEREIQKQQKLEEGKTTSSKQETSLESSTST